MKILDCTLRDGGYCNEWRFGKKNIWKIVDGLFEARIDIVECGFLTKKIKHDPDLTQFNDMKEISETISSDVSDQMLVCMINCGEYDLEALPECRETPVRGIRLAFHKRDIDQAFREACIIQGKGYALFLQPMVSLNYSDEEFLSLIRRSNAIHPYAFYIVDSFGVMKQRDLIRLFCLVEHNLDEGIAIGFHSHNNMQLSFSNAQVFLGCASEHELIIDASVYGMGRGAGNLNTELLVEFVNENYEKKYRLRPLLLIIDEILNAFYQQNYWGYSLPNYLSAKHNVHPNYAGYLDAKRTLTIDNMNDLFSLMSDEKKVQFDKEYMEQLYLAYMTSGGENESQMEERKKAFADKTILVIAPGRSCIEEKEKIVGEMKGDIISISVNFSYPEKETDFIFLSNLRRYRELPSELLEKCIVTSNIPTDTFYLKTDYRMLLNDREGVTDNAALMLLKFLMNLKCKEVLIAGMDGYEDEKRRSVNEGVQEVLGEYHKEMSIRFLTTPRRIRLYEHNNSR